MVEQGILQQWAIGFYNVFTFDVIFYILCGTFFGMLVGAIPGFTSSMACVILLPTTFFMSATNALVFLCAIYVAAMYGGLTTAILINTPGTSESSATTFDGYPMTQKGKAEEALGTAIGASVTGGTFSALCLLVLMAPIANFALKFGPPEMFLVALFGITVISTLRGESFWKGLLTGSFGLLIGSVGISPNGEWRSTFGSVFLADGIPIVPPIIGLFAMAELFYLAEKKFVVLSEQQSKPRLGKIFKSIPTVLRYPLTTIRSMLIGLLIGALPAEGATIAVFTSYNEAKRASKHPEKFGTGIPEGIIAAEAANNASTGGALMTTMALGIPGSATTAIILGAFILQGLRPGPTLLYEQNELVYTLIMSILVAKFFMVTVAGCLGYSLTKLLRVPNSILVPVVSVLCLVGSFAIRNTMFDVYAMFLFGILGWIMRRYGYPPVAIVLGIVLGPIADGELIRTYARFGDEFYLAFIQRPISLVLVILIILSLLRPFLQRKTAYKK